MGKEKHAQTDAHSILTGKERFLNEAEFIVSKTDLKGRITYVNRVFMNIADYSEAELIGKPHNLIRHPHMPRCVFKLLWDRVESGQEVFAYVNNRTKYGDHYWVLAHVTPSYDASGTMVGFHSNRRRPKPEAIKAIAPLYEKLLQREQQEPTPPKAVAAGTDMLDAALAELGVSYDEFIFSL